VVEKGQGLRGRSRPSSGRSDDRTARAFATSHVYFTSGAIKDIENVAGIAARKCGALHVNWSTSTSRGTGAREVEGAGVDFLTEGGLK